MYAKAWESLKSPDLPLPASIQCAVSLTSASSFRHVGGVSAGAQSTVTIEERLTSSGTETDSLIRRHPKIFLVSFEHLVQQVSNSLFQREGRGAFNCSFLRIDLLGVGITFVAINVSLFPSRESRTLLLPTNRKN